MARKRFSRKEIKEPDQFMVNVGRALEWSRRYRRHLIVGGTAVFVVLAGFAGWQMYEVRRERSARLAYDRALGLYESGQYGAALEAFRTVEGYGTTPYRDLAGLYVANSQLALGSPKDAIQTLETVARRTSEKTLTGNLALLTLALAQEQADDCRSALETIERVIVDPGPFEQEALLAKARCSVRTGQLEGAIGVYRQYLDRFPGGDTPEIALKLQELEAKAAGG